MSVFAVIDTETNWSDQVMSIGTVIANQENFEIVDAKYHILAPEYEQGGIYSNVLFLETPVQPALVSREEAMRDLLQWFAQHNVDAIFAYNAAFDHNHLPELRSLKWHDIMRLAAYRQYNTKIPDSAECFSTGRMKRGYGVEPMLRLLSGDRTYRETHNAFFDAVDELEIVRLMGYKIADYIPLTL